MAEKMELRDLDDALSFFELVEETTEPMIVTQDGTDAFAVMRIVDYAELLERVTEAEESAFAALTALEAATSQEGHVQPVASQGESDAIQDASTSQDEPTATAQPTDAAPISPRTPTTAQEAPLESGTNALGASTSNRKAAYENASLPNTPIDSDDYQRSMWHNAITERMRKVLAAEAPIEKQRLFNMVRGSFGIKRSGRDVQSHNEWLFNRNVDHKETTFNDTTFVWRPDQDPETYNVYRPTDEMSNRQITEFPYEELVAAMQDTLAKGSGLSRDELIEATMRLLGYKRKTNRVREVIGAAIEQANHDDVLELMPNGTFCLADH